MYRKCGTNVSGFIKKNCKDLSLSKNHDWFTEIRLVLNWLVESLHWRIIRDDCVNYLFTFHSMCIFTQKRNSAKRFQHINENFVLILICSELEWNEIWWLSGFLLNTWETQWNCRLNEWKSLLINEPPNAQNSLTTPWFHWRQFHDIPFIQNKKNYLCVLYCCVHQAINQSSWNDIINERLGA